MMRIAKSMRAIIFTLLVTVLVTLYFFGPRSSLSPLQLNPYLNIITEKNRAAFGKPNIAVLSQINFDGLSFPMYLLPQEFRYHSAFGGYFDEENTRFFLAILRDNPRLTFIDIGADIGTYSVAIARARQNRVIAVESRFDRMRLLQENVFMAGDGGSANVAEFVSLLHNAVSDENTTRKIAKCTSADERRVSRNNQVQVKV